MIYIFDGANLSGKTTLAKNVAKALNAPYVKKDLALLKYQTKDALSKNDIELIQQFFWEIVYPIGKYTDIVVDRSLLSSLTFSIIFQRTSNMKYIHDTFESSDYEKYIKLFFIKTDLESLEIRYADRGEELFSVEEVWSNQKVFEDVVSVINKTQKKIITINNPNGPLNLVVNKILQIINKDKYASNK